MSFPKTSKAMYKMGKLIDLTGKRFGMLTVIERANDYIQENGRHRIMWLCQCDCGNFYVARGDDLKSGKCTHCGCSFKGKGVGKKSKLNQYKVLDKYVVGITTNTKNEFFIDIDDYDKIKNNSWYENEDGYLLSRINGKLIRMHILIMDADGFNKDVEHKNHNTRDNRKSNLRMATRSQNAMNVGIRSNNTSGTTGVYYNKNRRVWYSKITINNKEVYLGSFLNKEDAIAARRDAEERYFKEFSYNNSIGYNT